MKNKLSLSGLFLGIMAFALLSCGDDEKAAKDVLLTTNRSTGQFYTINLTNGKLTPVFKAAYEGETLFDIRGLVYHPGEKAFYASVHSYSLLGEGDQTGQLFRIDAKTKIATMINVNDGNGGQYDQWDAIVNWAVDADDSLMAVGDFNSDGNGFVKFGTNGGRSLKTVEADVCCGLGMIYDAESKEALIGNSPEDGEVFIEKFDTQTGASIESFTFTTFNGFPEGFNEISETSWMPLKGLAVSSDGKYYGILFNDEDESQKTYFVSLDFDALTVTYISTLGISIGDQYSALTFVSDANF